MIDDVSSFPYFAEFREFCAKDANYRQMNRTHSTHMRKANPRFECLYLDRCRL